MTQGTGSPRRLAVINGGIQGLLLGPSLLITLVGVAVLSVDDYASFALFFALGSAAILLDGGSYHLAQIYRAEGPVGGRELIGLLLKASVAPLVLTVATVCAAPAVVAWLGGGSSSASWVLPLILGLGTLTRSWQNVLNGVLLGAQLHRGRLVAALVAAAFQVAACAAVVLDPSVDLLAAVYLVGGVVGVLTIAPFIVPCLGPPPPRAHDAIPTRTAVAAAGAAVTQVDRIIAGLAGGALGLAAYDVASRVALTAKTGCALLCSGLVAEGSRHSRVGPASVAQFLRGRGSVQRLVDRTAAVTFCAVPLLVAAVTTLLKPELSALAIPIGCLLAAGHGLHVTTAPATAFLSGARTLRPEAVHLCIIFSVFLAVGLPLTYLFGPVGTAAGLALGLAVATVWLRRMATALLGHGSAAANPVSTPETPINRAVSRS